MIFLFEFTSQELRMLAITWHVNWCCGHCGQPPSLLWSKGSKHRSEPHLIGICICDSECARAHLKAPGAVLDEKCFAIRSFLKNFLNGTQNESPAEGREVPWAVFGLRIGKVKFDFFLYISCFFTNLWLNSWSKYRVRLIKEKGRFKGWLPPSRRWSWSLIGLLKPMIWIPSTKSTSAGMCIYQYVCKYVCVLG